MLTIAGQGQIQTIKPMDALTTAYILFQMRTSLYF